LAEDQNGIVRGVEGSSISGELDKLNSPSLS